MEQETHHALPTTSAAGSTSTTTALPQEEWKKYDQDKEGDNSNHLLALSTPIGWIVKMVACQVELVTTAILNLAEPFVAPLSKRQNAPSRAAHRSAATLHQISFGLLGAACTSVMLIGVMVVAVLLSLSLVKLLIDEPVHVRQTLYFDYTQPHPNTVIALGGPKTRMVPTRHTTHVLLNMLMPESNHNHKIGIFQATEAIASNGDVIEASSQPCMLRYRSLPVRLMRTMLMGVPLLAGVSSETQKITMEILRYKERQPKTELIRVSLRPRAGTTDLPQLYEADIVIRTQLPWGKEFMYNWRWTFYVWTSFYMYIVLLIVLICCYKPSIFPTVRSTNRVDHKPPETETGLRNNDRKDEGISDELSTTMKKWRERRMKRKAAAPMLLNMRLPELAEGSASSSAGMEPIEASEVIDDYSDFAASESSIVCESSKCFGD
ncbi:hypothetical protein ACMD2_07825 [Ananas comosus]|uniref:Seipin-1 n=1 Tax=Ananas comosus TaxID=4615 RepID=A0A199VPG5_ANACO|nr:hypothetical protein ACMD2_07825 [Ananas comosus]